MGKHLRKATAFILTAAIILSCTFVGLSPAAQETPRDSSFPVCDGNCGYCPTIVIPGVFQSATRMYDDNGDVMLDSNGKPLTQLMVDLSKKDIVKIVFKSIVPLLSSLLFQADVGLSGTIASIASDVLSGNEKDTNGKHIKNIDVIRYKHSVAMCDQDGKDFIYGKIPLSGYSKIAGEDHLYFFTYNSFDSILGLADELYEFIQQVKQETGHDKINLVPISQGATIASALFECYKDRDIAGDLNRVVYIVPALDGSMVLSKIMCEGIVSTDEMLYGRLFPTLLDSNQQWLAYLINIALRLFPKNLVHSILDKTVASLADKVFVNSTCMWALTCSEDYDTLVEKYLSDGKHDVIKAETDIYHRAQVNRVSNILAMKEQGVKFFDVVNYDYPLYPLFDDWEDFNADGIIEVSSGSLGAVSAPFGQTLPDGYVEDGTYGASTEEHSYISPDMVVDATAGALCDSTFYFKNQDHEKTGRNDVIMRLAIELLTDEEFVSVRTYPDIYPQFNSARHNVAISNALAAAKAVDKNALSDDDRAELNAAIAEGEAQLNTTVVDPVAFKAAEQRLIDILVKTGNREAAKDKSAATGFFTYVLKFISNALYIYLGPRGFSDALLFRHGK